MSVDLSTTFLGLKLDNPLIAASCPLTADLPTLEKLESAGASAAVLPSLFEEQIEHEIAEIARVHELQTDSTAESLNYFPELDTYNTGPDHYLRLIDDAKKKLHIPIIASLNGATVRGWVHYAHLMEQAGADALELNIYRIPTDKNEAAAAVERHYVDLVSAVRSEVRIPLAVKIGNCFSSLPHFASELTAAGANGLVLFNRYLAPDIDLDELTFEPTLELSRSEELRVALRWIAILRDQFDGTLAATGGVHNGFDAAKALLVGSDVVMIASAMLQHGPMYLDTIRRELVDWMSEREYVSVEQLRGSMSMPNSTDPDSLTRTNYMKALTSFTSASS